MQPCKPRSRSVRSSQTLQRAKTSATTPLAAWPSITFSPTAPCSVRSLATPTSLAPLEDRKYLPALPCLALFQRHHHAPAPLARLTLIARVRSITLYATLNIKATRWASHLLSLCSATASLPVIPRPDVPAWCTTPMPVSARSNPHSVAFSWATQALLLHCALVVRVPTLELLHRLHQARRPRQSRPVLAAQRAVKSPQVRSRRRFRQFPPLLLRYVSPEAAPHVYCTLTSS